MKISDFSVNHRVPVAVFYIVVVVLGLVSFTRIGLDLFPDIDYPIVAVMARYRGVAPEEMEKLVTEHLESAAASVDGVRKVKAVSLQGACALMVEFDWEADLNVGAQDIRNQIELALDFLPKEVERPVVLKFDMDLLPVAYYGVYSKGNRDLRTLRKFIKDAVEKRLESLPGVASVVVQGGLEREIIVEIYRDQLKSRNITLDQISEAIQRQNIDYPSGHLDVGRNEFIVRTKGKYASLDEIKNTIVRVNEGRAIYVKDVARVVDSYREVRNSSRTNLIDSVLLTISKEPGVNTVDVVDTIKHEMALIGTTLPPDIEVVHIYDTSRLIRGALEQLSSSAFWGFFFAVAVIFLFLFSIRTTITLVIAMIVTIVATFIAVYWFGETLNIMTLSGIALGIGLIVDNCIVVMENIYRHIEQGEKRDSAAKAGTKEVGLAVSASTLTTVIVFLPLAFSTGSTGIMTRSLGVTVVFSILASLLIAITLVPSLASRFFKEKEKKEGLRLFPRFKEGYARLLSRVLRHQGKSIILSFALFLISLVFLKMVGTEYIPKMDESDGVAVIKLEPGLSLKDTNAFVKDMEKVIASQPEFVSMMAMVGLSEVSTIDMVFGLAPADVNEAEMYFQLKSKKERKRTYREICDEIYRSINVRKEAVVYFLDTIDFFLGGGERPIEVKIFGSDLEELTRLGKAAESRMLEIRGVVDLDNSMKPGRPELQIKVDRERASKLGITIDHLATTVDTAFLGKKSGKYRVTGDEYDIRVKYIEEDRDNPEDLSSTIISSPFESNHYLNEFAEVVKGIGPARINREDQKRVVVLSANVSKRDLGGAVNEIRQQLSAINLPEGYYIKYGGAYEDMEDMQRQVILAFVLVVLLVYLVMCAQFESFLYPLAILFSVPMSLVGVSIFLFLTKTTLSLMSFIGILMLVGIAVNNGIVLIDCINQLRRKGIEKKEAIIEGGLTRLRPILMSSLTTILALLPLFVLKGDGSEIFAPISITLLGGLLTSTLLTLLIMPAWYSLLDEWSKRLFKRNA